MDVRVLAELIAKAKRSMWGKKGLSCELARNMYLAESLIAHGVTVQEWISVKDERKPKAEEDVLVLNACGCDVAWLMDDGKWSTTLISDYPVTHWMPLPQPPKGE